MLMTSTMRPIRLTLSLIVTLVTATGAAAQTRPAGRPATYDVRHAAAFNVIYALPFGHEGAFWAASTASPTASSADGR